MTFWHVTPDRAHRVRRTWTPFSTAALTALLSGEIATTCRWSKITRHHAISRQLALLWIRQHPETKRNAMINDVPDDYTEVSAEKVAASQPDALLVLDYATLFGKEQPSAQAKADQTFKIAASSAAARQQRFFSVPAAAAHSGYRNILEIREIARFLHPDAFS